MGKLVIDGNSIYEIDEECMQRKEEAKRQKGRQEAFEEKKEATRGRK